MTGAPENGSVRLLPVSTRAVKTGPRRPAPHFHAAGESRRLLPPGDALQQTHHRIGQHAAEQKDKRRKIKIDNGIADENAFGRREQPQGQEKTRKGKTDKIKGEHRLHKPLARGDWEGDQDEQKGKRKPEQQRQNSRQRRKQNTERKHCPHGCAASNRSRRTARCRKRPPRAAENNSRTG